MKKKHLQPITAAALYARVSSDRQDVDLSVSAHMGLARLRRQERSVDDSGTPTLLASGLG